MDNDGHHEEYKYSREEDIAELKTQLKRLRQDKLKDEETIKSLKQEIRTIKQSYRKETNWLITYYQKKVAKMQMDDNDRKNLEEIKGKSEKMTKILRFISYIEYFKVNNNEQWKGYDLSRRHRISSYFKTRNNICHSMKYQHLMNIQIPEDYKEHLH